MIAIAALAAIGLLAACGSDGETTAPPTSTPATGSDSPTATATATATPTQSAASPTAEATAGGRITVYSGRTEELVGPIIERFTQETGIEVEVRYADTAELAATLLEEGDRSPADVFIAQDAGALGAVQSAGLFAALPEDILTRVPEAYRSPEGEWVGISGRARVVVYNTELVEESELPDSMLDFTNPEWNGRIGWAPTNGSLQAWVTALRLVEGEDVARQWLEGIRANGATDYNNNTAVVTAVEAGEVEVGFVNHYYLHRLIAEHGESFAARNHYTAPNDIGTLINIAGAGILESSDNQDAAQRLLDYLLSEDAQTYFTEETYEYPLIEGVEANADIPSITELDPVDLDLSRLEDLEGTLALMRETGVLP